MDSLWVLSLFRVGKEGATKYKYFLRQLFDYCSCPWYFRTQKNLHTKKLLRNKNNKNRKKWLKWRKSLIRWSQPRYNWEDFSCSWSDTLMILKWTQVTFEETIFTNCINSHPNKILIKGVFTCALKHVRRFGVFKDEQEGRCWRAVACWIRVARVDSSCLIFFLHTVPTCLHLSQFLSDPTSRAYFHNYELK